MKAAQRNLCEHVRLEPLMKILSQLPAQSSRAGILISERILFISQFVPGFQSSHSRSIGDISPTGKGIQLEHGHAPRVNGNVDGYDSNKVQNESSFGLEQPDK